MTDTPAVVDRSPVEQLQHTSPVSLAASQGTTIEQSRAVAEAQAAVVLAQHCPRNTTEARKRMLEACSQPYVAEDAFYSFDRGNTTIRDLTVKVARLLAGCWGNIEYGITELARDDRAGVSEMKAWAWDVQTNTRSSSTFIVPHRRDRTLWENRRKVGTTQDPLETLRDVQDNNANIGGRRLRGVILSVLPAPFVAEARVELEKTIARGDGTPLPDRIEKAVEVFAGLGIDVEQIEQRFGRPIDRWSEFDLLELLATHRSIVRGERDAEDAFPQRRVTADDIPTAAAPVGQDDAGPATTSEPSPPAAAETPEGPGQDEEEQTPPAAERPTEDELRASLKAKKITIATALKEAGAMHETSFGTLGDVAAHPEAGMDLADWIDQQ